MILNKQSGILLHESERAFGNNNQQPRSAYYTYYNFSEDIHDVYGVI